MKKILCLLICLSPMSYAQETMKIGIDKVFVVPEGFDSNDQVELIVDSTLPDACYKVARTSYKIEKNTINIEQFIKVKRILDCIPLNRDIKQFPKIPVRFTKVINIGSLPKGNYKVVYTNQEEKGVTENFSVQESQMNSIDDFHYAPISNAFIPELIYDDQVATVVLTGIINNSCMFYKLTNFTIKKFDHIFVIQPKVRFTADQSCVYVQKPLQAVIPLEKINLQGRYLIHVRSMSGQSVNKVFSVNNKLTDMRRESH